MNGCFTATVLDGWYLKNKTCVMRNNDSQVRITSEMCGIDDRNFLLLRRAYSLFGNILFQRFVLHFVMEICNTTFSGFGRRWRLITGIYISLGKS